MSHEPLACHLTGLSTRSEILGWAGYWLGTRVGLSEGLISHLNSKLYAEVHAVNTSALVLVEDDGLAD
jgi:hypothetical protein